MHLSHNTGCSLEAQGTRSLHPAVVTPLLAEAIQHPLAGHQFTGLVALSGKPGSNEPKRRGLRRMLARRSQELLERYRRGEPVPEGYPLQKALAKSHTEPSQIN